MDEMRSQQRQRVLATDPELRCPNCGSHDLRPSGRYRLLRALMMVGMALALLLAGFGLLLPSQGFYWWVAIAPCYMALGVLGAATILLLLLAWHGSQYACRRCGYRLSRWR
jgi:DNA-directed RNA polymerase subunit RPC12/RpoP